MSRPLGERQRRHRAGLRAEWWAAHYLRFKGYRILAERHKTPVGEVDLIARRGGALVFVEVKYRKSMDEAAESLMPRQKARIMRAADYWLCQSRVSGYEVIRFDVLLLAPFRWPQHIENAFGGDDIAG